MKSKLSLILLLSVGGLALIYVNINNNFIQKQALADASSIDDAEFIYKGDTTPVIKTRLNREELRHDMAVLVAAFERAYSGRDHLSANVYEKLISDVHVLGKEMPLGTTDSDGDLLCSRLATIFWDVPDNHLYDSCKNRVKRPVWPNVGENIHEGKGYFFEVRPINGKRVGVLSLGSFMPNKEDKSWDGFKEKIAAFTRETDALVIDLRGNHGGMSQNIRWLASFLYGNPAKMPDEIINNRKSAAACALDHNEVKLFAIKAVEQNQPVQEYLVKERDGMLKKFGELYKKEPGWSRNIREGSAAAFGPQKGYNKPIRILIDRGCASACENGFSRFLSHPKVKTYGTNTVGAYHYGDTEPLVLPNSGVIVNIPISYREYSDGRFFEKIGYAPDVRIPDGQDALEVALRELK